MTEKIFMNHLNNNSWSNKKLNIKVDLALKLFVYVLFLHLYMNMQACEYVIQTILH